MRHVFDAKIKIKNSSYSSIPELFFYYNMNEEFHEEKEKTFQGEWKIWITPRQDRKQPRKKKSEGTKYKIAQFLNMDKNKISHKKYPM